MHRQLPVALPEGYIDFYKNLETWQTEQQIRLKKDYSQEKMDLKKLLVNSSKPVVKSVNFVIDGNKYKNIYIDLLLFLKENRPETAATVDRINEQLDKLDLEILPTKVLADDQEYFLQLANRLEVPHELFFFTADHALRPFLRLFANPYYDDFLEDDLPTWKSPNICPFCGSKSHISRIRLDDSRRLMFCDRCFTEWSVRYLYCVHCGNDEPGTISYISLENDGAYQIYTCEKCKGYLKSYDEREAGKTADLFITNIETIYLDMLAKSKGYHTHDNE